MFKIIAMIMTLFMLSGCLTPMGAMTMAFDMIVYAETGKGLTHHVIDGLSYEHQIPLNEDVESTIRQNEEIF